MPALCGSVQTSKAGIMVRLRNGGLLGSVYQCVVFNLNLSHQSCRGTGPLCGLKQEDRGRGGHGSLRSWIAEVMLAGGLTGIVPQCLCP